MKLRILMMLAAGALTSIVLGCSGDEHSRSGAPDRSVTQLPDPSGRDLPELGEALMIALAQARNFHHKADVYLREGQVAEAAASVREILSVQFPEDAPEAEDVTLDARARLAKLLVAQGKLEEAMSVTEQGITGARRRSFFLANLYTVKGEVYEAMANQLDEQGVQAKETASQTRRNAIAAFDESIAINMELQRALMSGRGSGARPTGGAQ